MTAPGTPIDWARLIRLRERRVEHERESVVQERRRTNDAVQAWHAAGAERARRVAARRAHVQALREHAAAAAGRVSAWQLGGAYAKRLDARIAQALEAEQQAQAQHARCRSALAQQLQRLRQASAALRAAQTLQQRQQRDAQRLREQRLDEQLDDAARQQWRLAQRAA